MLALSAPAAADFLPRPPAYPAPTLTLGVGPAVGIGNEGLRMTEDGSVAADFGTMYGFALRGTMGLRATGALRFEGSTGVVRTTKGDQIRSIIPLQFGIRIAPDLGDLGFFVSAHAGPTIDRRAIVLEGRPNRTIHRESRWDLGVDFGFGLTSEGPVTRRSFGVFYQRVFTDGSTTQFIELVTGIWFG